MSRKFGTKITLMGLLATCILMATAGAASAVIQVDNAMPWGGATQNVKINPAPDGQRIVPLVNFDLATVDVLIADLGPCVGVAQLDLIIHNGPMTAFPLATQRINVLCGYVGNVPIVFGGAGPMMNAGALYTIQLNSPTIGYQFGWAYTNNNPAPGIDRPYFDGVINPAFDYKFRVQS